MNLKVKRSLCAILLVVSVVLIIFGRVYTFHMTESESLISAWKYWSGSVVLIIIAVFLSQDKYKK